MLIRADGVARDEATRLLGLADLVEAKDDRRARCRAPRRLGRFGRCSAGAAREPILRAELVEDCAADADPHVPVEVAGALDAVLADRVPQAAHAGRDEIVAKDVARQPA